MRMARVGMWPPSGQTVWHEQMNGEGLHGATGRHAPGAGGPCARLRASLEERYLVDRKRAPACQVSKGVTRPQRGLGGRLLPACEPPRLPSQLGSTASCSWSSTVSTGNSSRHTIAAK